MWLVLPWLVCRTAECPIRRGNPAPHLHGTLAWVRKHRTRFRGVTRHIDWVTDAAEQVHTDALASVRKDSAHYGTNTCTQVPAVETGRSIVRP